MFCHVEEGVNINALLRALKDIVRQLSPGGGTGLSAEEDRAFVAAVEQAVQSCLFILGGRSPRRPSINLLSMATMASTMSLTSPGLFSL